MNLPPTPERFLSLPYLFQIAITLCMTLWGNFYPYSAELIYCVFWAIKMHHILPFITQLSSKSLSPQLKSFNAYNVDITLLSDIQDNILRAQYSFHILKIEDPFCNTCHFCFCDICPLSGMINLAVTHWVCKNMLVSVISITDVRPVYSS